MYVVFPDEYFSFPSSVQFESTPDLHATHKEKLPPRFYNVCTFALTHAVWVS